MYHNFHVSYVNCNWKSQCSYLEPISIPRSTDSKHGSNLTYFFKSFGKWFLL